MRHGSISPDLGGVLGLAVADMVGNLAVPFRSLARTSTPSVCMIVVQQESAVVAVVVFSVFA